MAAHNPLVAEMLEASAAGFASAASVRLQQAAPTGIEAWPSSEWKAHLTQRILELASAVRTEQPALFARRVTWLQRAMKSRGVDDALLRSSLHCLHQALQDELPEAMKTAVDEPMRLAFAALDSNAEPEDRALDADTSTGRLGLEYLHACLEARSEAAKALVMRALDDGLSPQHVYSKVLLPAQREIGHLWHIGEVSVAEERLVTTPTHELMTLIAARYAPQPDESRTVVLAAVAGNAHDIGLRAVGDQFRMAGWRTVFLGADMPADEIARAAKSFGAKLIVLSATLTTHLRNLAATIERIRQLTPEPRILVGGLALADSPSLWQQVGADGYASSVDDAVEAAVRLTGDA